MTDPAKVFAATYAELEAERDRYLAALEWIAGCFIGDERKTYGDPTETMDRIRDRSREALCRL